LLNLLIYESSSKGKPINLLAPPIAKYAGVSIRLTTPKV
jgi:hypothetical protein